MYPCSKLWRVLRGEVLEKPVPWGTLKTLGQLAHQRQGSNTHPQSPPLSCHPQSSGSAHCLGSTSSPCLICSSCLEFSLLLTAWLRTQLGPSSGKTPWI